MGLLQNVLGQGQWDRQLIATQLAILIVSALSLTVIRRLYFSPLKSIPGPFLASISRWWHLKQIVRGDQQVALAKEHEKYGPFVRIAHDEVSVCHPDAIKTLILSPLDKGEWYRIFVLPDYRVRAPLGVRQMKKKMVLNKSFRGGYALHHVLQSEPQMDDLMMALFSKMDKAAASHTAVELGDWFSYIAYDITGEVTFSRSFGFVEKGEDIDGAIATNEALELFFTILGYFRWFSLLLCNPLTTYLEILPLGYMATIAKKALEERKKFPDARFDISAHWFRALEENGPTKYWDDRMVLAASISNLGAGSDTVSCGLQSFVYHLLRHPTGWREIQDEIDAARKEGRCQDAIITYEDANKLPYLQASLKEALRIFAPVPMGLPRVAPKGGITLGEKFFPQGTVLSVNPYVFMTSKEIWGPDAAEFNPGRWLGEDAKRLDKYFCAWGGGWAACPGQDIARIQMSKLGATLIRDYDVSQVDPQEKWRWMAYFTIVPKGWPVLVTKRNHQ